MSTQITKLLIKASQNPGTRARLQLTAFKALIMGEDKTNAIKLCRILVKNKLTQAAAINFLELILDRMDMPHIRQLASDCIKILKGSDQPS